MKHAFHTAMAIAITAALGSTAALAQSRTQPSFTGFGLGIDVSLVENSVEVNSIPSNLRKDSDTAALTASYGFGMGQSWVGTLGLSVGLKDSDYGTYTNGALVATAKTKEHAALFFAPGFRIGDSGLLYAKLAAHQMNVNYTNTGGFNQTRTHQGTGLGVGYAFAVSPSLEFSVEYESVQFESKSISSVDTAKPKQDNLGIGLAYRF